MTHPSRRPRAAAIALAAGVFIAPLSASAEPDRPAKPLLRGPDVHRSAASDAAPDRDTMMNEAGRPAAPPAELALDAVTLDANTRAAVEAVLDARAAFVDRFVREHRQTLDALRTARAEKDRKKLRELHREISEPIREHVREGTLEDRIAAVLPAEQAASYRATVASYRDALREARSSGRKKAPEGLGKPEMSDDAFDLFEGPADPMAESPATPAQDRPQRRRGADRQRDAQTEEVNRPARRSIRDRQSRDNAADRPGGPGRPDAAANDRLAERREVMTILTIEVPRAMERTLGQGVERLDRIIQELQLTAEQETRLRDALQSQRRAAEADGEDATPGGRRAIFRELAKDLTDKQRRKLRELARDGGLFGP